MIVLIDYEELSMVIQNAVSHISLNPLAGVACASASCKLGSDVHVDPVNLAAADFPSSPMANI